MAHALYTDEVLRDIPPQIAALCDPAEHHYDPDLAEQFRFCQKHLQRAVKFKLPPTGINRPFWTHLPTQQTPLFGGDKDDFKLPFPAVVLEFQNLQYGTSQRVKSVFLAVQTDEYEYRFYGFQKGANSKHWTINNGAFSVTLADDDVAFLPLYVGVVESNPHSLDTIVGAAIHAVTATFRCFLDALDSMNVENKKIAIPKSVLGQAKKKHKNFYHYRELVLVPNDRITVRGEPTGATRRTHLRRGHKRRLKNGETIWVKAHIVKSEAADQGVVAKHYRL